MIIFKETKSKQSKKCLILLMIVCIETFYFQKPKLIEVPQNKKFQ